MTSIIRGCVGVAVAVGDGVSVGIGVAEAVTVGVAVSAGNVIGLGVTGWVAAATAVSPELATAAACKVGNSARPASEVPPAAQAVDRRRSRIRNGQNGAALGDKESGDGLSISGLSD
jgi:hypothetical protein